MNEEHVSSKEGEDDFGTKDCMRTSELNAAGMEYSSPPILEVSPHNHETYVADQCNAVRDGLEDSLDTNEELHRSEEDISVNALTLKVSGDLQDTYTNRKELDERTRAEYVEEIQMKALHRRRKTVDAPDMVDKCLSKPDGVTRRQPKSRPPSSSKSS